MCVRKTEHASSNLTTCDIIPDHVCPKTERASSIRTTHQIQTNSSCRRKSNSKAFPSNTAKRTTPTTDGNTIVTIVRLTLDDIKKSVFQINIKIVTTKAETCMVQKYKRTTTKSFPKCGTNKKANENTPICKQNKNPVSDLIIKAPDTMPA